MKKEDKKWLKQGRQSQITPQIKAIASKFEGDELDKIIKILEWLQSNTHPERNKEKVLKIFATRTAQEIITQKNDTGCHDSALLLVTFLRASNIPAKYLLGIDKLRPRNGGHCVAEAYIKGKWTLIDPSYFQINLIPSRSQFYRDNYIVKKGLDSWDCGVKTHQDWIKVSNRVIKKVEEIK